MLAFPLVAGQLTQMLMGVADTLMIGRLGVLPLAAASFAMTVVHIPMVVGIGLLSAVAIRVSQARGRQDPKGARNALRNGMFLAVAIAISTVGIGFIVQPFFIHLGQDPAVITESRAFFLIILGSLVPGLACMALKNHADAMNRPWGAFWILLGGILLNIWLNWILIYGNLGSPAFGLEGAGWATVIARAATFFVLLGWIGAWGRFGDWVPMVWFRRPDWPVIGSLLRVGLPTSVHVMAEVGGFVVATLMIGAISAVALAAHQVAITCAATTFMIPLGISMALTVRMGEAWGADQGSRLRPIVFSGLIMGVAVMSACAITFLLAGQLIAGWFIPDAAVIALAAKLLIVAGLFQISDGVQIVAAGCLRGINDVRVPAWMAIGAYWLIAIPIGAWLAFGLDLGAVGVWLGMTLGLTVAAVALGVRAWKLSRASEPLH